MKKLKKTRAKLPKGEQILGMGVPDRLLNQDRLKKLTKSNSRTQSKRKRS